MNNRIRILKNLLKSHSLHDPLTLIPVFNNGVYLNNFLRQLTDLSMSNFLVLDGGSSDPETKSCLEALERENRVIHLPGNPGPRFFFENREFFRHLPSIFCVSDPDLELNPRLPRDFLEIFLKLSKRFQVGKVGFALTLEGNLRENEFFFGKRWSTIREWESKFWQSPIETSDGLEVYRAPIDTTFALYNKHFLRRENFYDGLRVAGNFSARHLPWFKDDALASSVRQDDEKLKFSTWNDAGSKERERRAFVNALRKIKDMENSVSWKITLPLRWAHSRLTEFIDLLRRKS